MKNKNKKIIQAAVVIIAALMILPSGMAMVANKKILYINEKQEFAKENKQVITLNGTVKAEWLKDRYLRNQWLGIVSPSINLSEDQTICINLVGEPVENETIYVNRSLRIDIEVIGEPGRLFLLGRYVTTCVLLLRETRGIFPLKGILDRWFAGRILTITRTNIASDEEKYIEIPFQYSIANETEGETIQMYVFVWGMFPGDTQSGSDQLPVIEHRVINLEVIYDV